MEVKKDTLDYEPMSMSIVGVECPNGEYVKYEDYKYLSDYCDRLVEIGKLPCLPKDLENLRNANTKFAQENHDLRKAIFDLRNEIEGWKNKWTVAVELAAKAENEQDTLKSGLHRAIELRNVWHDKWQTARTECIVNVDAVKELLDDVTNKA